MTDPRILRQRKVAALDQLQEHADALAAERPDVAEKAETLRNVRGRDYAHLETNRLEAMADLFGALVGGNTTREPERDAEQTNFDPPAEQPAEEPKPRRRGRPRKDQSE